MDGSNRKYQLIRRAYAPFVTRFVALSRDLDSYLRDRVGVPGRRVEQLYNGVDTGSFHPAVAGRARIDGCPFQDPRLWLVGTVGRMDPVKDQTNLARAFIEVLRLHPEARKRLRLVLIGDGSLRADVERVLREGDALGLAWMPGERSNVPDVMRGLDCFVLPSLGEGISNTILEAMSSGLPVVATRVGGNPELVEEGLTGRLVPSADPRAIGAGDTRTTSWTKQRRAGTGERAGSASSRTSASIAWSDRYDELYADALELGRSAERHASVGSRADARRAGRP